MRNRNADYSRASYEMDGDFDRADRFAALAVLDAPNRPGSNFEPRFRNRVPAHFAPAVAAFGETTSRPTYLLQHREQVLLCRHCSETVHRHRGPLADPLAERDRADVAGRLGQLRQLVLEVLLALG